MCAKGRTNRFRIARRLLAAAAVVGLSGMASAAPLNPNAFSSLGTLNVNSGSVTINTDTLAITGAATFNGTTFSQGGGNPQIAVFTFGSLNIGAGVTINVTGSRPLALLSRNSMTIASEITLNGGIASVPAAGAAGPAGGFAGGAGGSNGNGPGAGGNVGFSGDAGGAGFGGPGNAGQAVAGPSYGNLLSALQGGSGGAGGIWFGPGGGGGGGAGAVELGAVGTLTLASVVANGGTGGDTFDGAGGGGSGGGILLHADAYVLNTLAARGGDSFRFAGAGGGGRIAVTSGTLTAAQIAAMHNSVDGGNNGFGNAGTAGALSLRPVMAVVQSAQSLDVGITPGQTGRADALIETLPGAVNIQSGGTANLVSTMLWGSGSFVNVAGGILNIANDTTFSSGSTLNWTGGDILFGAGRTLAIHGGTAATTFGTGLSTGATLRISGGGTFAASTYLDIGNSDTGGATGTLLVDGAGSRFISGGLFSDWGRNTGDVATITFDHGGVGTYGSGVVIAGNGGVAQLNLLNAAQLNVASMVVGSAGSSATINLNGGLLNGTGNMTLSTNAWLYWSDGTLAVASGKTLAFEGGVGSFVGGTGFDNGATLRIAAGGVVTAENYFDIGNDNTGGPTGTLIVSGAGSRFTSGTTYTDWGRNAGDSATITIQNSGAATYSAGLQIGADGGNALVSLLSSGKLYTTNLVLGGGVAAGPTPKIVIQGGQLTVDGDANIATRGGIDFQSGTLAVSGTLTLSDNGTIILTPGGSKVVRAAALTMTGTSKINLADNDLIVNYDGASPLSTLRSYIVTGRNGGNWLGNGITSTSANSTTLGLGYGANDVLGMTTFDEVAIDSTTVLIKFTYYGDGNLDGAVDIRDLYLLASNYNGSGKLWTSGDFNYDGLTNAVDLGLLAKNWQAGVGSPLGQNLAEALAFVGMGNLSVPEPAISMVLLAAIGLRVRRRR